MAANLPARSSSEMKEVGEDSDLNPLPHTRLQGKDPPSLEDSRVHGKGTPIIGDDRLKQSQVIYPVEPSLRGASGKDAFAQSGKTTLIPSSFEASIESMGLQVNSLVNHNRVASTEFPSLNESHQKKLKLFSFAPPFDLGNRRFGHTLKADFFPFEEVKEKTLKIKSIPIQFNWKSQGDRTEMGIKDNDDTSMGEGREQNRESRWFRAPPKVKIVSGILGLHPSANTRGKHPGGGEPKGHSITKSDHRRVGERISDRIDRDLEPYPHSSATSTPLQKSLTKFVGHLRGKPVKSFATAVRAEPAPTVVVKMYPRGGGRRGSGRGRDGAGQGREGFGGDRSGRGGGRVGGRFNTWKRKDDGSNIEQKQEDDLMKGVQGQTTPKQDPTDQTHDDPKNKWDEAAKKVGSQPNWAGAGTSAGGNGESSFKSGNANPPGDELDRYSKSVVCEICGMSNHTAAECRKFLCELCGYNNHSTFECRRCVPWNFGPELCATQVEDQSFMYIDECIDARAAKEKSNTAIISVISGAANPKQIELEFQDLIGADKWRWNATPIADGKFMLRFPLARMAQQWCHLRNLTLRNGAQVTIEPWAPVLGVKAVLQVGWFRVSGIPVEQRSIRVIAKVGGLVGKVVDIDEETRYRHDYVKVQIACRDLSKVPKTAESALGLYVIDFGFEREIKEGEEIKTLSSGIKITDGNPPPPNKKFKSDDGAGGSKQISEKEREDEGNKNSRKDKHVDGKQSMQEDYTRESEQDLEKQPQNYVWSAPPKMNFKPRSQTKLLKNAQRSFNKMEEDMMNDKVFIPEMCIDSESDSDSFGEKIKKLSGIGSTKEPEDPNDEVDRNIWFMENTLVEPKAKEDEDLQANISVKGHMEEKTEAKNNPTFLSPEIFITEDMITQSQGSEGNEESHMLESSKEKENQMMTKCDKVQKVEFNKEKHDKVHGPSKRRSERVAMQNNLTVMEKVEAQAKKRNLEGLYNEIDKETLRAGVDAMMKIAIQLVKRSKKEAEKQGEAGAGNQDGSIN